MPYGVVLRQRVAGPGSVERPVEVMEWASGSSPTRFTNQDRMLYWLGSPGLPTTSRLPHWSVAVGTTSNPQSTEKMNVSVC